MEHTNKSTYITHYREIPEWLEQSANCFHLLAAFARRARRIEGDVGWRGENIHLLPREFIAGRKSVSKDLGLTEGEYRHAYQKLINASLIQTIRTTKRYTIGKYLADSIFEINLPTDSPLEQPSELPSSNQPTTTNNNEKNVKNDIKSRLEESPDKSQESPSYKEKPLSDAIERIRAKHPFLQRKRGVEDGG